MSDEEAEVVGLDDELPAWAEEEHDVPPDEPEDAESSDEDRLGNRLDVEPLADPFE